MKNKLKSIIKILTVVAGCLTFASFSPSLDGRAVVVDEGIFPQGLFAKTVGYLPGDIISVTNISGESTVDILVIGALDPSEGVAIMLSPEAAEAIGIDKTSNNIVKITKRSGQEERVYGNAVISKATDELDSSDDGSYESIPAEENQDAFEDAEEANPEETEEAFDEEAGSEENPEAALDEEEEAFSEESEETSEAEEPEEESLPEEELAEEQSEDNYEEKLEEESFDEEEPEAEALEEESVETEEYPEEAIDSENTFGEEENPEEEAGEEFTEEYDEEVPSEESFDEEFEDEALPETEDESYEESVDEEDPEALDDESPAEEAFVEDELEALPEENAAEVAAEDIPAEESALEATEEGEEAEEYEAIVLVPADSNPPAAENDEVEELISNEEETIEEAIVLSADEETVEEEKENPATKTPAPVEEKVSVTSYEKYLVPSLKDLESGKYYIQIAVYSTDENILSIIEKYGTNYPITIVPMSGGIRKQVLIGPLTMDEYAVVLERFKSYGFKDSFLRKIK